MIAIKFENGKVVSYKYPCSNLKELRPTSEGFTLYDWDGNYEDITYLTVKNGSLQVDEAGKAADRQKADRARKAEALKTRLTELDMDINACTDGVKKAKTEGEYRAERAALRNELRQLQGKEALQVTAEK